LAALLAFGAFLGCDPSAVSTLGPARDAGGSSDGRADDGDAEAPADTLGTDADPGDAPEYPRFNCTSCLDLRGVKVAYAWPYPVDAPVRFEAFHRAAPLLLRGGIEIPLTLDNPARIRGFHVDGITRFEGDRYACVGGAVKRGLHDISFVWREEGASYEGALFESVELGSTHRYALSCPSDSNPAPPVRLDVDDLLHWQLRLRHPALAICSEDERCSLRVERDQQVLMTVPIDVSGVESDVDLHMPSGAYRLSLAWGDGMSVPLTDLVRPVDGPAGVEVLSVFGDVRVTEFGEAPQVRGELRFQTGDWHTSIPLAPQSRVPLPPGVYDVHFVPVTPEGGSTRLKGTVRSGVVWPPDGPLEVDVGAHTVRGRLTVDGGPPASEPGARTWLVVDGQEVEVSSDGAFAWSATPGTYSVAVASEADDCRAAPCGRTHAQPLRLDRDGVRDLEVRSHSVDVMMTVDGRVPRAQPARVSVGPLAADFTAGPQPIRGRLLEGTYPVRTEALAYCPDWVSADEAPLPCPRSVYEALPYETVVDEITVSSSEALEFDIETVRLTLGLLRGNVNQPTSVALLQTIDGEPGFSLLLHTGNPILPQRKYEARVITTHTGAFLRFDDEYWETYHEPAPHICEPDPNGCER
jgi:hypothetical protein